MILEKETFEKFGYWPKNLKKQSHKKCICKCVNCGKIFIKQYKNVAESKTKKCRNCSSKEAIKCAHKLRTIHLNNSNRVPINNKILCDLLYNSSVRKDKNSIRIYSGHRFVATNIVLSVFELLNIDKNSCSTKKLKKAIQNYLLNQNNSDIFNTVNYIFSNIRKLSCCLPNDCTIPNYKLSDSNNYARPLLDKLGYKYTTYHYSHSDRKTNGTKIIRGSFFINNRWIHIGD